MNQSGGVRGGQTFCDLPADLDDVCHWQPSSSVQSLLQRLTRNELHDQVGQRLFLDGVNLHDVLMPHRCRRSSFSQEPLPRGCRRRQVRSQQLHGDHAMQIGVQSSQNDTESAGPEKLQHLVMPDPSQRAGPIGRGEQVEPLLAIAPVEIQSNDQTGVVRAGHRLIDV